MLVLSPRCDMLAILLVVVCMASTSFALLQHQSSSQQATPTESKCLLWSLAVACLLQVLLQVVLLLTVTFLGEKG
jgi:hypothetical protein